MGVFKLQLEDFSTTEYELIAIHTTLEITKLAFLLNKNLETRFHFFDIIDKTEKSVKGSFERFSYNDESSDIYWNLIGNKSVINAENNSNSLFDQFGQTLYLIPEYKKVDYLIKIENSETEINEIIKNISKIKSISLTYKLDKDKLKTKSNLIF